MRHLICDGGGYSATVLSFQRLPSSRYLLWSSPSACSDDALSTSVDEEDTTLLLDAAAGSDTPPLPGAFEDAPGPAERVAAVPLFAQDPPSAWLNGFEDPWVTGAAVLESKVLGKRPASALEQAVDFISGGDAAEPKPPQAAELPPADKEVLNFLNEFF
jgi:hypothetical protein